MKYKKNPAEMVRQLLKNLIGEKKLSSMKVGTSTTTESTSGVTCKENCRPGIDRVVLYTVESTSHIFLHYK